jgi:hypothetical protein
MVSRVEASIQRALVDWFYKTYSDYALQATLNENSRHSIEMGIMVGITDLLIFARKNEILHVLFLELKTKCRNSILRPSQEEWHKKIYLPKLQANNTHYAVAKGLSEAKKEIVEWVKTVQSSVLCA